MVESKTARTVTADRGLKNSFLIHATVSEMGLTGALECGRRGFERRSQQERRVEGIVIDQ